MSLKLHIVPRQSIDADRWDSCVKASPNGLIYSETKFLDTMAKNWMGIVSEDYSVVCAIPWNKKFGIRYIYPPPYVQQSGLIGTGITETDISEVIKMMRSFSLYGEYYFNFSNRAGAPRNNFILDLNRSYDPTSFPADFRYDLKKASSAGLVYETTQDHKSAVDLYLHFLKQKKNTGDELSSLLNKLVNVYAVHHSVLIRKVSDPLGNLLSTVLCLRDNKRIYLLLSATTPDGRKMRANHFLMDKLLQELMPSSLLLDFVGSDIEGIAHYYSNFTDQIQPYYFVKWNDLPIPLRWLKK